MTFTGIEKPPNKIGAVIGFFVHLLVLAFTIAIVWTAKPSSSECRVRSRTCIAIQYGYEAFYDSAN